MSDIAILEHIVYLLKKYENVEIEADKDFQRQFQMYMMYSSDGANANEDIQLPETPFKIEDKATEIIARIKAVLENQSDTK